MKRTAILYSTTEGQAKKIAYYIAMQLGEENTDVIDIATASNMKLADYGRVIIGASIRYGSFKKTVYQYIEKNLAQLESMPSYFYGVNLTARKEGKDTPEGSSYIQTFLKKTPWKPKSIGVFAGALYYPRYRWYDRMMIRLIMTMTGGETDTTKEIEYTNWESVTAFAQQIKESGDIPK